MVEAHTEHKALGNFWRGTGQCAETESGSGKEAGSDSIRRLKMEENRPDPELAFKKAP